jgi:hypothetical protein
MQPRQSTRKQKLKPRTEPQSTEKLQSAQQQKSLLQTKYWKLRPAVIKVEGTVVTQEADPVTITAKGEETKTGTETTTDKIDTNKTFKTKIMATPNADTTPATKSDAEKTRHTRLTQTMKAMMDKTLTFRTKAMTMPPRMNFTLPTKSFTTQTRPMTRKKMMNLSKIQMTKA